MSRRPVGHSYSTEAIFLAVRLFLNAAVSFRGCSAVVALLQKFLPGFRAVPAPNSVQSWLLRLGLHELTRPKPRGDDWVLILDQTIQLGRRKCLVIVGIRLSAWQQLERPLTLEDLTLIQLDPLEKSTGEVVSRQLETAAQAVGIPRAVLSDQGGELTAGIAQFTAEHPDTLALNDIAHRAANLLKRELRADDRWPEFSRLCGQTQPQVKQTELAHLAPPAQKVKGRYMNLGALFHWAVKLLALLETPPEARPQDQDLSRLEQKFGWLRGFRQALTAWKDMQDVIDEVLPCACREGYHAKAASRLQRRLQRHQRGAAAQRIAEDLIAFVQNQSQGLQPGERVPASSEVLESLIGKGKRMQGQHSRNGFTKMVLAMAACVGRLTLDSISEALERVRHADLKEWIQNHLGTSLTTQRRRALPSPNGTKTG